MLSATPPKWRQPILLVLLLPAILTASWHARNLRLPDGDAAGYVETALRIANAFNADGLLSGTGAFFLTRGFRPNIWPIWEALALILSKGEIYASIGLVLTGFMLLFSVYTYLFLRLYIKPGRAVLGAVFVSTMPWVAEHSYLYYSELSCVVFALALGYHYIQSHGFRRHDHAIASGIFLGLVLCTRPDLCPALFLPLIFIVLTEHRRGAIAARDILPAGLLSVALTFEAAYIGASDRVSPLVALAIMSLTVCSYIAYALSKRKTISMGFFLFVVSACSVSVIWFGGFLRALYYWAYAACCSIPFDIRSESQLQNVIEITRGSFHHYGILQLSLLSVLLVLVITPSLYRTRANEFLDAIMDPTSRYFPVVIGLAAAPPMALALLISGTTQHRRLMVPAAFLFVGLIAVILGNEAKARLGLVLIWPVVLLQIYNASNNALGPWQTPLIQFETYTGDLLRPKREPDTNWDFIRALSERGINEGRMAVYTFTMYQSDAAVYDPATLSMLAARETPKLSIGYLWDPPNLDVALSQLRQSGFQYVALDVFPDSTAWNVDKPYIKVARELTDSYLNSRLGTTGLREIVSFKLHGREQVVFLIGDPKAGATELSWRGFGGRPGTNSEDATFPVENLNDGKTETAWGSLSDTEDVYAYITLATPMTRPMIKVQLFSPGGRNHLKEIRVVARNEWTAPWTFIRSRVFGDGQYSERIIVPPGNDGATVSIELDPSETDGKPFRTYGIACLRKSKDDVPNYLGSGGTGVYLREMVLEGSSEP